MENSTLYVKDTSQNALVVLACFSTIYGNPCLAQYSLYPDVEEWLCGLSGGNSPVFGILCYFWEENTFVVCDALRASKVREALCTRQTTTCMCVCVPFQVPAIVSLGFNYSDGYFWM